MTDKETGPKLRPTLISRPYTRTVSLSAYTIESDGGLVTCEVEDFLLETTDKGSANGTATNATGTAINGTGTTTTPTFWLDADIPNSENDFDEFHDRVLSKLSLTKFLKRNLTLRQMQTPQVLALSQSALVVTRVLLPSLDRHASSANSRYHSAAVCFKDKLVTATFVPQHATEPKSTHAQRNLLSQDAVSAVGERELPESSVSGALAAWLQFHLSQVATETQKLRMEIFALAEQMDQDVTSVGLSEIVDVKDRLLRVLAVTEEQNECLQSLAEAAAITAAVDFSKSNNLKGFLGVLLSSAGSTERMALRLEKRVDDLRQSFDAHQQDRINRRLAVLTILSAVFLPLTLMAGIWGMNFVNMPELERENAYYFALSSMALVAIVLLLGFYRFGWLN